MCLCSTTFFRVVTLVHIFEFIHVKPLFSTFLGECRYGTDENSDKTETDEYIRVPKSHGSFLMVWNVVSETDGRYRNHSKMSASR